ncbi:MAG: M14 family zinc carboxypeptidase, partial [Planctomycetota bacterium]
MFRRVTLALFLLACVTPGLLADGPGDTTRVRYDGHKLVRVVLDDARELEAMLAISQDHWTEGVGVGEVDFRVPPEGLAAMEEASIDYTVIIENIQPAIDAEWARLVAGGGGDAIAGGPWFDDFKNYDAVNTRLDELEAQRPDLAEVFSIGNSLEGRAINGIRITGAAPGDRPAILLNSCQHAREWISVMVTMYVADTLINDYDTDPVIQELVDSIEWLIIPIINPDGYVYSWGPERLWRKNRRNNGDGTFGVDNNRNWGYEWGGNGSSGDTSSETYRGPAPFSEPETQVIRDFYIANPQIVANIDFHAYGQLVLSPWGYTSSPPPGIDILNLIGEAMADAIQSVHGEFYEQGPINPLLYPADGVSVDWCYGDQGVLSYTIELRPTSGNPGFVLPPEEIIPTSEEAMAAVVALGDVIDLGPQFSYPMGLPGTVEADLEAQLLVDIMPIGSPIVGGSETLYARVGTDGPYTTTTLVSLGGSTYEGTLPAAPCGSVVQFYVEAETEDGAVHADPPDAPTEIHEADAVQTVVFFQDDFESDLGWGVSNSGGLADGAWERGVPISNAVCDRGNPGSDADGSGSCYVTDNSSANACNSDVDDGSTTLTSPVLDASDPEATVTYWRWYHNSFGGDPFNDIFEVEVSDDAGGSWVDLETVGPAGPEVSGGWFYKEFRIADVAGIANTSQFQIRFTASDLGSGSVVEAGVDGVQIVSRGCDGSIPEDLDGDGM